MNGISPVPIVRLWPKQFSAEHVGIQSRRSLVQFPVGHNVLCSVLSMVGCTKKIPVVFRYEVIAPGNGFPIWEKRVVMKVNVSEL